MFVGKRITEVDRHVGRSIRSRRILRNMSQEQLAEKLGITFQQIQKYEKGANRVSASRLQEIADILQVSPGYFFEGRPGQAPVVQDADVAKDAEAISRVMATSDGMALVKAFARIERPDQRRQIVNLIESMAA